MIMDSAKRNTCKNALRFWFRVGKIRREYHRSDSTVQCIYGEQFNKTNCHPFTIEYVKESTDIGLCEDCARELGLIW